MQSNSAKGNKQWRRVLHRKQKLFRDGLQMTMRQMHVYSINANLSDQNNIIIGLFFLYESNFKLRHSMTSILPDSSVSTVITQGMEDKKILIFVTEGGGGAENIHRAQNGSWLTQVPILARSAGIG